MFNNLKRQKELVDQEVEIYRREQKLLVDAEVLGYRKKLDEYRIQSVELAQKSADDMANLEHDYHEKMETRGIEIAKLEAKKEFMEAERTSWENEKELMLSTTEHYKEVLDAKDEEIERLSKIIDNLIDNLPEFPDINVTRR